MFGKINDVLSRDVLKSFVVMETNNLYVRGVPVSVYCDVYLFRRLLH